MHIHKKPFQVYPDIETSDSEILVLKGHDMLKYQIDDLAYHALS